MSAARRGLARQGRQVESEDILVLLVGLRGYAALSRLPVDAAPQLLVASEALQAVKWIVGHAALARQTRGENEARGLLEMDSFSAIIFRWA
jgi:hypothetical protein